MNSSTYPNQGKKILFIVSTGLYILDTTLSKVIPSDLNSLIIVSRTVIITSSAWYLLYPGANPVIRLSQQMNKIQQKIKGLNAYYKEIEGAEQRINQEIQLSKETAQKILNAAEETRQEIFADAKKKANQYLAGVQENYQNIVIKPQEQVLQQIISQLEEQKNKLVADIQRLDATRQDVIQDIKGKQIAAQQEYEQIRHQLQEEANLLIENSRQQFQAVLNNKQAELNDLLAENHLLKQQIGQSKLPTLPPGFSYAEGYARSLINLFQQRKIILHFKSADFFQSEGVVSITVNPDDPYVNSQTLSQYKETIKNQFELVVEPVIVNEGAAIRFKINPSEFKPVPAQRANNGNAMPNEVATIVESSVPQMPNITINSSLTNVSKERQAINHYLEFLKTYSQPEHLLDPTTNTITDDERNYVLYLKIIAKIQSESIIIAAVWHNKSKKALTQRNSSNYKSAQVKYINIINTAKAAGIITEV